MLDDELLDEPVAPTPPPLPPPAAARERHEWISFVAEPKPLTPVPARPGGSEPPPLPTPAPAKPARDAEEAEPASFLITSIAPASARRATPEPVAPAAVVEPDEEPRVRAPRGDAAEALRARQLAADPDRAHEAAAIQRARFEADPTRLDALDALIDLAAFGDRRGEALGLTQVRAVLRGEAIELRPLHPVELEDPPDGVARVLLPSRLGPFAELGTLLWDSVGVTWRRELLRSTGRDDGVKLSPNSPVLRPFQAALRLLQLPRSTALLLRDGPSSAPAVLAAMSPVSLVMPHEQAADTPAGHFALGHLLEAARTGHLPLTALAPEAADRMVRALAFAFGAPPAERVDPSVAQAAAQIMDATPTRLHRQVRAYVEELGGALTPARWRAAIDQARARAGLLVSGDFFESSRWLLASAPAEVPRSLAWAFVEWEPLRELLRFAVSEEYLMLRWPNSDGRRRRVSTRPGPPEPR